MSNCPACHNPAEKEKGVCLFCGARLSAAGKRFVRFDPAAPREKRTFAGNLQRLLLLLTSFVFLATSGYVLLSPPTPSQLAANDPLSLAMVPLYASFKRTEDIPSALFSAYSRDYSISLSLSDVKSDDPDTLAAADDIRGEQFPGILSLRLAEDGTGTLLIDQLFFTPEEISVLPFTDSQGVTSSTTVYGYITRAGMKLSVVCVCDAQEISGFIWMDSESAHIEFLYHS